MDPHSTVCWWGHSNQPRADYYCDGTGSFITRQQLSQLHETREAQLFQSVLFRTSMKGLCLRMGPELLSPVPRSEAL